MTHYHVIENTPGYLPEDDNPFVTTSLRDAQAVAQAMAADLREDAYRVSGNKRDGYYGERSDTVAPDLGRVIEIMACNEADCMTDSD